MYFLTGLTAGNAAGYRGGARNTGTEDILLLPAVLRRSLLPGSQHRQGFLLVLGLRVVVQDVAASLWPAVAAAAVKCSPDISASPLPAVAAAATLRRLVNCGTYPSLPPCVCSLAV